MGVPGSNLLAAALTVIQPQGLQYRRYKDQGTDAAGVKTATYDAPVTLYGSFQPVSRNTMAIQGLEMDKRYALFYASQSFKEPGRDGAGDLFSYGGRQWQAMGGSDWYFVDGWDAALLVDVGADA